MEDSVDSLFTSINTGEGPSKNTVVDVDSLFNSLNGTGVKKPTSIGRYANIAATGANRGAANVLGAPVDVLNTVVKPIMNSLPKPMGTDRPVGGSEWFRDVLQKFSDPVLPEKGNFKENLVAVIPEQGMGYVIPSLGVAAKAGKAAKLSKLALPATGSAVGSATARTYVPDSPMADLTGQILGGVGAAVGIPAVSKALRPRTLEEIILHGINKGVRPNVKNSYGDMGKYNNHAVNAVKTIIEHKPTATLTDSGGRTLKGVLPKNLMQFSEAISKSKSKLFDQFDAMATSAGNKGAVVDFTPAIKAIKEEFGTEISKAFFPEDIANMNKVVASMEAMPLVTPKQAQELITRLNKSLMPFYKNPTSATASAHGVNEAMARHVRSALDDSISKLEGNGYQSLKNAYGSLKTIESDVAHRVGVDLRKNTKGLIDFSDIYNAGKIVTSLGDPASMASVAATQATKAWYKRLNDPNKIISKMFEKAEKRVNSSGFGLGEGVGTAIPEPPNDLPPKSPEAYDPNITKPQTGMGMEGNATPAPVGDVLEPNARLAGKGPRVQGNSTPNARPNQSMGLYEPNPTNPAKPVIERGSTPNPLDLNIPMETSERLLRSSGRGVPNITPTAGPNRSMGLYEPNSVKPTDVVQSGNVDPTFGEVKLGMGYEGTPPALDSVGGLDSRIRQLGTGFPKAEPSTPSPMGLPGNVVNRVSIPTSPKSNVNVNDTIKSLHDKGIQGEELSNMRQELYDRNR